MVMRGEETIIYSDVIVNICNYAQKQLPRLVRQSWVRIFQYNYHNNFQTGWCRVGCRWADRRSRIRAELEACIRASSSFWPLP